jgi:hypothetical protein
LCSGARHHNGNDQQREERLDHGKYLGSLAHDRGVGGAEGRALVEGQEQVVREVRRPAGRAVLILRELKIGTLMVIAPASSRPTLVDLPVLHSEGHHVREPD